MTTATHFSLPHNEGKCAPEVRCQPWREAQNAQQLNLAVLSPEQQAYWHELKIRIEQHEPALGAGAPFIPTLICAPAADLDLILKDPALKAWLLQGDMAELEAAAQLVSVECAPRQASLCSITNVKSGQCSEDCKWCAQSKHYDTQVSAYELKSPQECLKEAQNYYAHGVEFYSLVASGRAPSSKEFAQLLTIIDTIKASCPIKLCVSLGLVTKEQLSALKAHGVVRYHCNLETAPSYFAQVCTTHSFADKLAVLKHAATIGLEVCSGALFNLGESMEQRLELAQTLRQLGIKSIPLNFLHPIVGTPLEHQAQLSEDEVKRTIYLMRLLNPTAYLRWAGGRILLSPELIAQTTAAAMNAAITGDLLTTTGSTIAQDRALFAQSYTLPPEPQWSQLQDLPIAHASVTATCGAHTSVPHRSAQVDVSGPHASGVHAQVDVSGPHASGVHAQVDASGALHHADLAPRENIASGTAKDEAESMLSPEGAAWHQIKERLCPEFDRKHLWHPYTSAQEPLPALKVKSAHGVTLELEDGTELIDGMSSWWCCNLGYNLPELNQALTDQVQKLAHVMFAGFTHDPAIKLGQKLLSLLPGMEHIFYADSGSVATEVALKMALQYQVAQGKPERNSFLTFTGGYHGDTWNAMSVSDPSGMHELFHASKYQRYFAADHLPRFLGSELLASAQQDAQSAKRVAMAPAALIPEFAAKIAALKDQLAAVILEPIVQGAGGMNFYAPEVLTAVAALCREHDILLICDEIATGFGRTGKMFACEHAGITPDLMLLGKGLTGGYMTLSAVLCTTKVARAISTSPHGPQVFMHGPTFMANPLACAVACAAVEYLETHQVLAQVSTIAHGLKEALGSLAQRYQDLTQSRQTIANPIKSIRAFGAIGVVEFEHKVPVETVEYLCYQERVWLRPMGNLLYTMPALTMPEPELKWLTGALSTIALRLTTGKLPNLNAHQRSPFDSAV